ncbi:TonB-dependent receptor [Pedobacter hartonius]|uniref:Iron complex outermembrane recepter protein n=1 Tax=Pedobacter hartonius TaxID=425514 RepID=A0A1H4HA84_9SPHI|nr:TonB-dependent receptor [Pedobacter hartonius]SEB18022.1 iron complex outermembrane recepter protein [Pedobacter hartonius]
MQKNYRSYFITIIAIFMSMMSFAQNKSGTITGTVRTSDGISADAVEISIKGIANTTVDRKGNYTLKNVPAGQYTVTARLIGLKPTSSDVNVIAGSTVMVDLTLEASNQQLQEVEISHGKKNKYFARESDFVSKMPLKNLENPQVYSVITKELLADQVVTNFDDALKNAPGLDKLWSASGRAGDGAGYFTLRGFAVQPKLVNGLPGLTNGSLDVSNVERIEVLKGPSGTLFGSSLVSYGGLINTVTKQPFDQTAVETNYTAGSYGLNRVTVDLNTPLDAEHKVLFRLNAAYHDENSFQDAGFRKSRFFAPSLSYQLNDRVSFLFNAQFLSSEGTNPTQLFFNRSLPLKSTNLAALGYNNRRSYTTNELSIKNPVTTLQAQMNYKISDQWRSQTIVSRGTAKSDGYYSYLFEGEATVPGPGDTRVGVSGNGIFDRWITDQNSTTETTDIQQNFVGDFNIGGIRNRIVAGLDYYNSTSINNSSNYAHVGSVNPLVDAAENLSKQRIDTAIAAAGYGGSTRTTQEVYSAYVSDVINITPAFSAMASLRADRFQNGGLSTPQASKFGQTAFSPKFGLVYQVIKDQLSVFGNYMNGFTNVAPVNQQINGANVITIFDPEHANQTEGGIKADLFDGKLSGSLSYYDIKVSNIVLITGPNTSSQGGEQYSKGFEAQITANPVDGLNIIAGYTKNKSKLTNADPSTEGRRPLGAGPEDLANLWIGYKIATGSVKGLGFGFGGNYSGKNMIVNDATVGVFTLPSYTILNAAASYGTGQFTFGLKVDNLTDKEYYKGWSTLEPMRPRTFAGSVTFRF